MPYITFCFQCLVIINHYLSIHYCFFLSLLNVYFFTVCLLIVLYINCYQFKCFFHRYIQLYLIVNYLPHLCHLLIIQKHIFFSISLLFTNAYSRKYAKTLVHIYMYTYNIKLLPHTYIHTYIHVRVM